MHKKLCGKAYAKINLTLEICGKRDDGFHNIKTVFGRIGIFDDITITKTEDDFSMNALDGIPNEKRLEYIICKYFFEKINKEMTGIKIETVKRIPEKSGLGGESSDGATTLVLLNKLFGNPLTDKEMLEIALKAGSDVPFFILNKTFMLGEGRGEILTETKGPKEKYVLIVFTQEEKESTKNAYEKLDDMKKKIKAKNKNVDYSDNLLYNDFELIYSDSPKVGEVLNLLKTNGSKSSHLCGAGTACFGLFETKKAIDYAYMEISAKGYKCIKTKFV